IQLLENDLVPSMNQWKQQGVDGQNKRSNTTKYLSIVIAFVQAIGISFGLYQLYGMNLVVGNNSGIIGYVVVALIMTAGTAILMWIADRITEKGIGNGMSVLIMAGILSQMPSQMNSIYALFIDKVGKDLAMLTLTWSLIAIITLMVIIMVIYYNLAYTKIPINYVRSGKGTVRKNSYLPIKLNPAGVIPVIFAQPFVIVIALGVNWICDNLEFFTRNGIGTLEKIFRSLFDAQGEYWVLYVLVYGTLIVAFSVFYSYVQMNPENMTENLEKQSAYIIGVRPGEDTLDYFSKIIVRTTLWGGFILALLAVMPTLIQHFGNITVQLQLMGTGLIIVVSVLVQTYQSLKNKVESKKYRRLIGE
ncbi:MAG: preprotein translocase subunit SecY, partial [Mycoplasmatales bacterium]